MIRRFKIYLKNKNLHKAFSILLLFILIFQINEGILPKTTTTNELNNLIYITTRE